MIFLLSHFIHHHRIVSELEREREKERKLLCQLVSVLVYNNTMGIDVKHAVCRVLCCSTFSFFLSFGAPCQYCACVVFLLYV